MRNKSIWYALAIILAASNFVRANAVFTGSGTSPDSSITNNLAAEAVFATVNVGNNVGTLTVTLTNTSHSTATSPSQILTAVFFDIDNTVTLTKQSAIVNTANGSKVWTFTGTDWDSTAYNTTTDVGGEWAYRGNLNVDFGTTTVHYGISSSGLGNLFGPKDLFPPKTAITDPLCPDGLQFGIAPMTGDNKINASTTPNLTGNNQEPLLANSVVFEFTFAGSLHESDIKNVYFQYGTDLTEPRFPGTAVPLPASVWAGGIVLAGLGILRIARNRRP